jgi:hypothetical protein
MAWIYSLYDILCDFLSIGELSGTLVALCISVLNLEIVMRDSKEQKSTKRSILTISAFWLFALSQRLIMTLLSHQLHRMPTC